MTSNVVQFSPTAPSKSCLKYMNFYLGVQGQDYGPTSSTGFWAGLTGVTYGYVLYLNKASQGPSIYYFPDDESALSFCTNNFKGLPFGVYLSWNNFLTLYWGGNIITDSIIINRKYENIITDDMFISIDPSFYMCTTFSGGSPNTVKNLSFVNLTGEANNNINNSAEKSQTNGGILSFDGVTDRFVLTDFGVANPQLKFSGNVTYELFIRFKELTGTTIPIYFKSPLNEGSISANTSNKLVYSYGNGSAAQTFETTSTLSNNTWYHIVLVRDLLNTQKLYWYINGVEDRNIAATYSSASTSDDFTVFFCNGFLGDVYSEVDLGILRVYGSALTESQVLQNFNSQKSRFGL